MVDRLAREDSFSGVVLLALDGKPVFNKAWGEADKTRHRPNRPDTQFNYASLGKLLPQAAVDQLLVPRSTMMGTGKLYGYGFTLVRHQSGGYVFGHEGGFPGVSALLEVDPKSGYILVVLSNYSAAAPPVADAWRDLRMGPRPK